MLVGVGAERDVAFLPGDQIEDLDAVTARPDVLVAAYAHREVGEQAAVAAEGEAGRPRERRLRADPDAEDDHVGRVLGVLCGHRPHTAVLTGEDLRHLGVVDHRDAQALHGLVHQAAHVRVERRHGLAAPVDDRHLVAPVDQRLGHLHPDVAGADHDGAAARCA